MKAIVTLTYWLNEQGLVLLGGGILMDYGLFFVEMMNAGWEIDMQEEDGWRKLVCRKELEKVYEGENWA